MAETDKPKRILTSENLPIFNLLEHGLGPKVKITRSCLLDENRVLLAASNGMGVLMTIEPQNILKTFYLFHGEKVESLTLSNNGKIIAVCSDESIKLWDADTLLLLKIIEAPFNMNVNCIFSPGDKLLLCGGSQLSIWNVDTGEMNKFLSLYMMNGSFNANGTNIIICDSVSIKLLNANTYEIIATWVDKDVCCGIYTKDGNNIIVTCETHIKMFDNQLKQCYLSVPHIGLIHDIILSPCGKYLFTMSNILQIWSLPYLQCIDTIDVANGRLNISKDGRFLVNFRRVWKTSDKFWVSKSTPQVEKKAQTEIYTVDLSQLKQTSTILGKGAFGNVYQGTYFKLPVAIKQLNQVKLDDKQSIDDFEKEMKILTELRHNHIVLCLGCSKENDLIIVLEYMSNGSLYKWIQSQKSPIKTDLIYKFLSEIALGMHYLHSRKPQIIHRDLKSLNILLSENLVAKVTDFGLSKTKENSQLSATSSNVVGTIPWTAPEYLSVRRKAERNEKGDVYSFGVIAWELLTRQVPWKAEEYNAEDIKDAVLGGDRLAIPADCPFILKELITKCWNNAPAQRPGFDVIVDVLQSDLPKTSAIVDDSASGLTSDQELQKARDNLQKKMKELNLSD